MGNMRQSAYLFIKPASILKFCLKIDGFGLRPNEELDLKPSLVGWCLGLDFSWAYCGSTSGSSLALSVCVCLFVSFDSLRPSQQIFSYDRTGLPGLNQYSFPDT